MQVLVSIYRRLTQKTGRIMYVNILYIVQHSNYIRRYKYYFKCVKVPGTTKF
jgi:hypothetical protein